MEVNTRYLLFKCCYLKRKRMINENVNIIRKLLSIDSLLIKLIQLNQLIDIIFNKDQKSLFEHIPQVNSCYLTNEITDLDHDMIVQSIKNSLKDENTMTDKIIQSYVD